MSKKLLFLLAVVSVGITGCKKDKSPVSPSPPADAATANSYFPLTAGSNWTYDYELRTTAVFDTGTVKMTGTGTTINNKPYYGIAGTSKLRSPTTGYYFTVNHISGMRAMNTVAGSFIELQFFNDTVTEAHGWVNSPTDNGLINGYPARCLNTLKGKGITISLGSKTYTNVVNTQIDLQYNPGGGFQTMATYQVFLAKSIGLVLFDTFIAGKDVEEDRLITYNINQ